MPKHYTDQPFLSAAQIASIESQYRVPVDDLFGPMRNSWLIALAKESLLPSDKDLRILRDIIEFQARNWFFKPSYADAMLAAPLAADPGWNTVTFYFDEDGWHARRSTWREGPPFWPARYPERGQAPGGTLAQIVEHLIADGSAAAAWAAHKASRPELYGPQA